MTPCILSVRNSIVARAARLWQYSAHQETRRNAARAVKDQMMRAVVIALVAGASFAGMAEAGTIERACLASDRPKSRALCGCIQQAADVTLNGREQRMAARLFREPHRAQEIRQSDRRGHERFWIRYKRFGATAEAYCRRG
jgi:hypothetical protein